MQLLLGEGFLCLSIEDITNMAAFTVDLTGQGWPGWLSVWVVCLMISTFWELKLSVVLSEFGAPDARSILQRKGSLFLQLPAVRPALSSMLAVSKSSGNTSPFVNLISQL